MGTRNHAYYRRRSPWIIQRSHRHVLHFSRSRSRPVSRLGLRNSDPTKEYETIEVHAMILEAMGKAVKGEGPIPTREAVGEAGAGGTSEWLERQGTIAGKGDGLWDIVRREYPSLVDKRKWNEWDGRELADVPPTARWTKINRKLVNPESLVMGKERFEVREDFVVVLRVLTKDEVQGYAALTQAIRVEREGKELDGIEEETRVGESIEMIEEAKERRERERRERQERYAREDESIERGERLERHQRHMRKTRANRSRISDGKNERESNVVETNAERRARERRELNKRHALEEQLEREGRRTTRADVSDTSSFTDSSTESDLPQSSGGEDAT